MLWHRYEARSQPISCAGLKQKHKVLALLDSTSLLWCLCGCKWQMVRVWDVGGWAWVRRRQKIDHFEDYVTT